MGLICTDINTPVLTLIEAIWGIDGYRVKYLKDWHAKQYATALLWGDWKESYNQDPRVLSATSYFKPGVYWVPYTGDMMGRGDGGVYKNVLRRVFWCFPQCMHIPALSAFGSCGFHLSYVEVQGYHVYGGGYRPRGPASPTGLCVDRRRE